MSITTPFFDPFSWSNTECIIVMDADNRAFSSPSLITHVRMSIKMDEIWLCCSSHSVTQQWDCISLCYIRGRKTAELLSKVVTYPWEYFWTVFMGDLPNGKCEFAMNIWICFWKISSFKVCFQSGSSWGGVGYSFLHNFIL